ncbi:sulfatase-like hydrolase/transferase [Rhodopirellula sallentina]|uniref:Sulfatase family protein n=1 Tax=Rhodopirellula sallentina SM41 TaxID=1263870 RepID=M5U987_9BACT|nr:sulfatase-like hydrolase/transferase [Rhodopirellula sallentina]EMI52543.1 sulfatase family protein [Rhodopirellula sallentina SM41]
MNCLRFCLAAVIVRFSCVIAVWQLIGVLFLAECWAGGRPNIVLVYADDISARELPIYGSSTWTINRGEDSSDPAVRAKTPVLDQMAQEGCWIKTAWASVVCSPSRAMMMTGRYAHLHKWWNNSYKGRYRNEIGKVTTWPLYESSPMLIGYVAQQGGYATYWAGKTQMPGDLREYGFDQGCFTPGSLSDKDNPFTDFKIVGKKVNGQKLVINEDTGEPYDTYDQHGWYFYPHVRLMNHADKDFQWWPNTPETIDSFGLGTYGPDVELDFIFDFMDRQHEQGKPFFVYHTTHLGHGAFDWLNPENGQTWPGTPVIRWDGDGYTRTEPKITGDHGDYDTHDTVTDVGIHHHINYLDYQMWLYRKKLAEMGIADNTVIVFCADNGTAGYGKNSHEKQKGVHVPMIIYAPGMTKHGEQDVLVNMSDLLPTIAELTGVTIPDEYEHNGESLVPFLFTDQTKHREWLYGYSRERQMIRGDLVMKDGYDRWYDVSKDPADLISFPEITNWNEVSEAHRAERDKLLEVLPEFDLFETEPDAPGSNLPPKEDKRKGKKTNKDTKAKDAKASVGSTASGPGWMVAFEDSYDDRTDVGGNYTIGPGMQDGWSVTDGVLLGQQVKDAHGSTIRVLQDFDDVDIQFDFQFQGGTSFNLVIDDQNEKSVHAGHICRVSISPKRLRISDDKKGGMNLEVRKQRQNPNLSPEESEDLVEILASTQSAAKVDLQPNDWHNLRVRIKGETMKVFLDGELATTLKSPGIDHPTKNKFGFTVNGTMFGFDNLVVRTPADIAIR